MSRAFSPGQAITTGQSVGTLDYVAPEQIEGIDLDGRTDQYSLACTGFELLCGAPPFGQDQGLTLMYAQLYAPAPAATARRDLPEAVDRVLGTALAKRPADRYPSCGAFADELRAALGLRAVDLTEPDPHEPGRPPSQPSPPASAARARRPARGPAIPGPGGLPDPCWPPRRRRPSNSPSCRIARSGQPQLPRQLPRPASLSCRARPICRDRPCSASPSRRTRPSCRRTRPSRHVGSVRVHHIACDAIACYAAARHAITGRRVASRQA